MNAMHKDITDELQKYAKPEKASNYARFFKTGPGEYGEGDQFLGLNVPDMRKVAKLFKDASLKNLEKLLHGDFHEYRLTALYILVDQYQKAKTNPEKQTKIYNLYLKNIANFVNNWDLVDSSAPHIVGNYLFEKDRKILYKLAKSKNLWEKRVSMLATFYFIRNNDFDDTIAIAEILVNDKHDLIHKAVGWMLREVGNRDMKTEEKFLKKHYKTMPRTMLRYAIEKFPEEKRKFYMGK